MTSVVNNQEKQRYELEIDGHTAFADYRRENDILTLTHVEAPPALRGTGAAGRLMEGIMQSVRQEKLKVIPLCSYAAAWLQRHPQYQ